MAWDDRGVTIHRSGAPSGHNLTVPPPAVEYRKAEGDDQAPIAIRKETDGSHAPGGGSRRTVDGARAVSISRGGW